MKQYYVLIITHKFAKILEPQLQKYTQLHKIKSISSGVFGMNDLEPKIPEFLRQSVTRFDFGFY